MRAYGRSVTLRVSQRRDHSAALSAVVNERSMGTIPVPWYMYFLSHAWDGFVQRFRNRMASHRLNVAIPWSLSHYIPLDGFHPLYRALFDHVPKNISLSAWDNVKLYRKFRDDASMRRTVVEKAKREEGRRIRLDRSSIAKRYQEYFRSPDHILTTALQGDLEFHHTTPFPSLTRPFVFHCESFAPVLFPFAQQGNGNVESLDEIRSIIEVFLRTLCVLESFPMCPIPLLPLSILFRPRHRRQIIVRKHGVTCGCSLCEPGQKPSVSRPRFLFINSANQNSVNFFRREGISSCASGRSLLPIIETAF